MMMTPAKAAAIHKYNNSDAKRRANRRYYEKHGAKSVLRTKFGMTFSDKVEMYHNQKGLCALCNLPLPVEITKAHIDHDHETGEVRGLLHPRCNYFIGFLEQFRHLIARAYVYLKW